MSDVNKPELLPNGKTMRKVRSFVRREGRLTKGQEIAMEGNLTNRSWEDKDGNIRFMTEIICIELLMFSK